MTDALETLFYPLGGDDTGKTAFLNAQICSGLSALSPHPLCQQVFKPYAIHLQDGGYQVIADAADIEEGLDTVFLHAPKNKTEAQYMMAQGARILKDGGILYCAAANDAGGNRLLKFMEALGFEEMAQESKNKARVVWGRKAALNGTVETWIEAGASQAVLDDSFISRPGIFGWDKIDQGSEILTRFLSKDLKGRGADFGCGYGYLGRYVLENCKNVRALACIDADIRAVRAAQENLKSSAETSLSFRWEDLTTPVNGLQEDLDFIVMNPPFHEGKASDSDIGVSFIRTAHLALRKGGRLYMVANRQLPYESVLEKLFTSVKKCHEGGGFKVFEAVK